MLTTTVDSLNSSIFKVKLQIPELLLRPLSLGRRETSEIEGAGCPDQFLCALR